MNLATVGHDVHQEESEEEISKIDNKEEWRDDISTGKKKKNEVMLDRLKRKNPKSFEECFPTWGHIKGAHGKYVQIHEKRSEKSSSSVQKDSDEVFDTMIAADLAIRPEIFKIRAKQEINNTTFRIKIEIQNRLTAGGFVPFLSLNQHYYDGRNSSSNTYYTAGGLTPLGSPNNLSLSSNSTALIGNWLVALNDKEWLATQHSYSRVLNRRGDF